MSVNQRPGNYPHIRWIDLKGNGVMTECAIIKEDGNGNIYFLEVPSLDKIDKGRIVKILTNRNANSFELWDLMSQMTLNNGVNALTYFHQLVKIITPAGVIMNPRGGTIGTGKQNYDQQNAQDPNFSIYNQRPTEESAPVQESMPEKEALPPKTSSRTTKKIAQPAA